MTYGPIAKMFQTTLKCFFYIAERPPKSMMDSVKLDSPLHTSIQEYEETIRVKHRRKEGFFPLQMQWELKVRMAKEEQAPGFLPHAGTDIPLK